MASPAEVLRAKADAQGCGRGRVIDYEIRREMMAHARERMCSGVSVSEVARELGITSATLKRWMAPPLETDPERATLAIEFVGKLFEIERQYCHRASRNEAG
jgi:DNA invertase Pin-like site-specific DNA recombinase